jgi:hypothetical protein
LQQMMLESFAGKHGLIDALESLRNPNRIASRRMRTAEVLAFPRPETVDYD